MNCSSKTISNGCCRCASNMRSMCDDFNASSRSISEYWYSSHTNSICIVRILRSNGSCHIYVRIANKRKFNVKCVAKKNVFIIHRYTPCYRTLAFHSLPAAQSTVIHCNFYADSSHEYTTWQSHYGPAPQAHWIVDKMNGNDSAHDDKIKLKFGCWSPTWHANRWKAQFLICSSITVVVRNKLL